MPQSTVTEKGQTTVPVQVRKAMNLTPHQKIQWEIQPDGSVLVRPQSSALDLYGSLKPKKIFPGIREEKESVRRAVAHQAAKEGID
ncbi:MAG: type II toxin-antitoxin system PrlF family antitoxin [Candidatus Omnitrophota bacterium]